MLKAAASTDLPVVEGIMKRILDEEPSYWPHGLSTAHFDGGLYLVQKSASSEPVGFVGWQKRAEAGRNVGYYSIGILPEHREQGFAKSAVAQVIQVAREHCDVVKALVEPSNTPSKALARSLGVEVIEKEASKKGEALSKALQYALGTAGTTAVWDRVSNLDQPQVESVQPWKWDEKRKIIGAMNAALGATGVALMRKGHITPGIGSMAIAPPTKDLVVGSLARLPNLEKALDASAARNAEPASTPPAPGRNPVESIPRSAWVGAGALGVGALGLGLAKLVSNARTKKKENELRERELENAEEGMVHVTLPTKNPGDMETKVQLPIGDLKLSKTIRGDLGRDTRRRLRAETHERIRRRKPKKESEKSASERFTDLMEEWHPPLVWKSAGAASKAPPQAVPSPPVPGQQGPAAQMQAQQATANSIDTSTAANPSIMKAEQAAMEAQNQATQQVAQQEQQAQQAQMDQQAQFQQELSKKEEENQVLRIQAEKAKAEKELAQTKDKATASSKAEDTQTQRFMAARLNRLENRVGGVSKTRPLQSLSKLAGAVPQPFHHAAPETLDNLNDDPGATQFLRPTGVYRAQTWYEPFYGFFRRMLMSPSTRPQRPMDTAALVTDPDKFRPVENLYRHGMDRMRFPIYNS